MSDEGLLSVEDDGPDVTADDTAVSAAPPVAAADQASADSPAHAPPEDDSAAEVEAVEVAGKKYVPVGAVIAERKQRQALQEKASRTDALEAEMNNARPYVEFLKANPELLRPRQAAPPPASFGAPPDPQVEALAKTLDLYTPEGQPDLVRAATIRTMMTETAQQIAQQAIQPFHTQSYQDQSARNFQIALQMKDAQGRTPSREALVQIWRTMSPEQTADPNVASILALTALGLDSVSKKPAPVPPANAPLVTEGQGGAGRRPALSALEQSLARDRGMSEAKWQEHTKGFQSGRPQLLED